MNIQARHSCSISWCEARRWAAAGAGAPVPHSLSPALGDALNFKGRHGEKADAPWFGEPVSDSRGRAFSACRQIELTMGTLRWWPRSFVNAPSIVQHSAIPSVRIESTGIGAYIRQMDVIGASPFDRPDPVFAPT